MAPDYSVNTTGPAFESTQEFFIMYILTLVCAILFVIPFKTHFVYILHIGHIIIGLYWAAHETEKFQVPVPKAQDGKPK